MITRARLMAGWDSKSDRNRSLQAMEEPLLAMSFNNAPHRVQHRKSVSQSAINFERSMILIWISVISVEILNH